MTDEPQHPDYALIKAAEDKNRALFKEELTAQIKLDLKAGHTPMYCALAHGVEIEEVNKIIEQLKKEKVKA
jgi:hypothetical protein